MNDIATSAADRGTYRLRKTLITEYCSQATNRQQSQLNRATSVDMKRYPSLAIVMLLFGCGAVANAQTLPSYMAPIAGKTAATPSDIATKDMLALNTGMFDLYGDAAKIFQQNVLSKHPVILALFSGAGGRMILYRPGMAPTEAPQVPIVYQLRKPVG